MACPAQILIRLVKFPFILTLMPPSSPPVPPVLDMDIDTHTAGGMQPEVNVPQHTARATNKNRFVTILRNNIEQINKNTFKRWGF